MFKRFCVGSVLAVTFLSSFGCVPRMMDMSRFSMSTERPKQLEQLEPLIGEWDTSAECTVACTAEKTNLVGTMSTRWACDKRIMIEEGGFTMGDEKMTGMGVWAWDGDANRFRRWWFESNGQVSESTVTYDESSKTFRFKGKGKMGPSTDTASMKNHDTFTWTHTLWSPSRTRKLMEMQGQSVRKK